MKQILFVYATISLLFYSVSKAQIRSVTVVEASPALEDLYNQMAQELGEKGPDQAAKSLLLSLKDPANRSDWAAVLNSTDIRVKEVKVHPNRKAAIELMNKRLQKIGVPQLNFKVVEDPTMTDPNELDYAKIAKMKWLRYTAGPGVALAATCIGLPEFSTVGNPVDYALLILPSVGVGVTTILLEFQFAHPWLNNHFWKRVWEFGGPVTGRLTNVFVNFLYGMALYGAGVGAAHLPILFGGSVIPFEHLPFAAAATSAFIGGVIFHIAMGQYQTDISQQQSRGNMTAEERYAKEGIGVITNNSARILNWVMPAWDWVGYLAQWGFFAIRTVPQLWQTHLSPMWTDSQMKKLVTEIKLTSTEESLKANLFNYSQVSCSKSLSVTRE